MGDRIVKGLVLGVGIVFAGLLWAVLGYEGAGKVTVSPVMHARAWPKRERPYVLLFYDPLCPVCRRLEGDLEGDGGLKAYVRYLPAFLHQGSYEAWLSLLLRWGWDEAEARAWLEILKPEVEASGLTMTPTVYVVDAVGREKVIVGYPGYGRWRKEVLSALGVGP